MRVHILLGDGGFRHEVLHELRQVDEGALREVGLVHPDVDHADDVNLQGLVLGTCQLLLEQLLKGLAEDGLEGAHDQFAALAD